MKHVPSIMPPTQIGSGRTSGCDERPCGLVLDCDGVIVDSKKSNDAYYNHIRSAVRLAPMTEEEAAFAHMASTDEALERIIPDELKEEAQRARESMSYRDTFMLLMQPAPHMTTFLHNMRTAGLRIALCTNRGNSAYDVLKHFDIEQYFSPVITITQVTPKPSPEGLLKIADEWGAAPGSIIFLGDSIVDQQAATAAGVPFWSYGNPCLDAGRHIENFRELNEIMTARLAAGVS